MRKLVIFAATVVLIGAADAFASPYIFPRRPATVLVNEAAAKGCVVYKRLSNGDIIVRVNKGAEGIDSYIVRKNRSSLDDDNYPDWYRAAHGRASSARHYNIENLEPPGIDYVVTLWGGVLIAEPGEPEGNYAPVGPRMPSIKSMNDPQLTVNHSNIRFVDIEGDQISVSYS
jgi:hypothetical protein